MFTLHPERPHLPPFAGKPGKASTQKCLFGMGYATVPQEGNSSKMQRLTSLPFPYLCVGQSSKPKHKFKTHRWVTPPKKKNSPVNGIHKMLIHETFFSCTVFLDHSLARKFNSSPPEKRWVGRRHFLLPRLSRRSQTCLNHTSPWGISSHRLDVV